MVLALPRFGVSVVSGPDWLRMTLIRRYGTTCHPGITLTIDPALISGSRHGMNQHTTGGFAGLQRSSRRRKRQVGCRMLRISTNQSTPGFQACMESRSSDIHGNQNTISLPV